jgi:hypothetical protein
MTADMRDQMEPWDTAYSTPRPLTRCDAAITAKAMASATKNRRIQNAVPMRKDLLPRPNT